MAERNRGTSNRNRRGSVGEWINDFNEATAQDRTPENRPSENQPSGNQPSENRPPENRPIEETIQWTWEQMQVENGGQEIEEIANDRTLEEWISITENKDLFRSSYGGEGDNAETSPVWTDKPENRRFYGRPKRDDDDEEDDQYGAACSGNRIGTTQAYVSGTTDRGNRDSGGGAGGSNSSSNRRSSNNNNRSVSGSINSNNSRNSKNSKKRRKNRNSKKCRNSVGTTTEESTTGRTNVKLKNLSAAEYEEEEEDDDEDDIEQTKNRTFYDWLKYTKNPHLYKTENEMDDDDDDEYNDIIKYINLETIDDHFWENSYAQIVLAAEIEQMDSYKKRKRVYSLFNGGSEYESVTSPNKRMTYSLFALQNCDIDDIAMEKDDLNKTPSMFDIRKNETNYSENFPENTLKNRFSSGVNKSTDSFESDSSITPLKLNLHRRDQNTSVREKDMGNFFNLNTIYETEKKSLEEKMEKEEGGGEEEEEAKEEKKDEEEKEEEEEGGKKKKTYEPSELIVELTKKRNEMHKMKELREKREDQMLHRKGNILMDLEQFAFLNTTKRASSCKSDMLHYMETNSETEITTASPGVNEIEN